MINENTPYKLAEIIRDTWPGLFNDHLTRNRKSPTMYSPNKIGMSEFFNDLTDRLQHTEQLSRKNAKTAADIQFADGIKYTQKLIRELRTKHNV